MSEEEKQQSEEGQETEATPEDAPAEETPAAEQPVEEEAAPAAEEEPSEEPAPEEQGAPEAPPAPEPAADADAEAEPTPKQRRKLARATFTGEPRPPRSPEERAAERADRRRSRTRARQNYRVRQRQRREAGVGTPPAERVPGTKKVRRGTVVSSKADKTITVQLEVVRRHPVYEKVVRRSATVHAHDERNEANEGDVVRLVESRPLSRTKRWRLVEVLERAR